MLEFSQAIENVDEHVKPGNTYARAGQPTKYRPEYCEQAIELGDEGKSICQIARHFEISRQTLENWASENPEFLAALAQVKTYMQANLEGVGYDGMFDKGFNGPVWKTTMQARFREDYTERQEHKINGQIEVVDKTPVEMARLLNFAVHQLAEEQEVIEHDD